MNTFRCSQLAQVLACPASAVLVPRILAAGKPKDTTAAVMGQWCHAAAAIDLVANHGAVYSGAEPLAYPQHNPSAFSRWIVRYYLQTINELTHADMALEVEAELAEHLDADDIALTGHIDCFAISPDASEAIIYDLKSGAIYVLPAADNAQILGYIVLLKLAYPTLRKIAGYIIQPTNDPDSGFERVTEVVVEGEALDAAVAYVTRELRQAAANPYSFNSDGRHCAYCPAALTCPAIAADLEAMKVTLTQAAFDALKLKPELDALARTELTAKKFAPIFDECHDLLKERLGDTPQVIDGVRFWIEPRPGKRTITDNAAASEALRVLPDERFHRCYEFRPAQIEDVLAEHFELPKASKKGPSGKSKYTDLLGPITEQKTNRILKIA